MSLQGNSREKSKWQYMAGLATGPVVLLAMLLAPQPAGVSSQAWAVAAVGVFMVIWWTTEAVPLATTALLPVLLLALASAMTLSGLVNLIAEALSVLGNFPLFWLVFIVMIVVVYLGELASNTAMAAIFLHISGAFAIGTGADTLVFTLPVAAAASLGFMLPVATPPNAIVFGSGAVTVQQMLRAGAILDVVCIVIVAVIVGTFGYSILGL